MIHIKSLKKGSLIGIAAPAGPFSRRRFLRGVRQLKKQGFRVQFGQDIFAKSGYLAGTDQRRLRELNRLLTDPTIEAILFARGGFGTQHLLPYLKKPRPKVVVGLSDLTVLCAWLWQRYHFPSLYGPMVVPHLIHRNTIAQLKKILTDPNALKKPLVAKKILHPGQARGLLVGGCLTLVVSLLGTPFDIDTRGKILFLEDTDEPPYVVDRMLTQLGQAGRLRAVRGIILGTFRFKDRLFPKEIRQVFVERLKDFPGPILWGLPFGHCQNPFPIPFGGRGRIQGKQLIIEKGLF